MTAGGGGGGTSTGTGLPSQTNIAELRGAGLTGDGGGGRSVGGLDGGASGSVRLSYGLNHHPHRPSAGPSVSSPTPASTASLYGRPSPFHGYLPGVVDVFDRLDPGNSANTIHAGNPYRPGNPFSQLGACGAIGVGGGGGGSNGAVGGVGTGLALSPGASTAAIPNGSALTGPGFRDYLSPTGSSSSDGYGNGGSGGIGGDYCNGSGMANPSAQVYPWMTIVGEFVRSHPLIIIILRLYIYDCVANIKVSKIACKFNATEVPK